MKTRYIIAAVAVVLLLGFGTAMFARAEWHGGPFHHGKGGILVHLTRKFDLTAAQQTEVKQMWQAEKPSVVPLVQQLAQLHKQMIAATANGNFDQAKVTAIANQQSQVLSQLIVEKAKLTSKFYTLLTPEQRTKFDTMQQRRLTHIDNFVQKLAANQSQ
jgi:protein CpxP